MGFYNLNDKVTLESKMVITMLQLPYYHIITTSDKLTIKEDALWV